MKKIDKNQLDLFGPQVWYEYLVVVSPDEAVTREIASRKVLSKQLAGPDLKYLDSKAHITLLTFLHTEHELILRRLKSVLAPQTSFEVTLSSATFFEPSPESKTLYIKVNEKQVLQNLSQKLRDVVGRGKKSNPHMTIVGGLNTEKYKALYDHLNEFKLDAKFLCRSITVLRRVAEHTESKFEMAIELPFGDFIRENQMVAAG